MYSQFSWIENIKCVCTKVWKIRFLRTPWHRTWTGPASSCRMWIFLSDRSFFDLFVTVKKIQPIHTPFAHCMAFCIEVSFFDRTRIGYFRERKSKKNRFYIVIFGIFLEIRILWRQIVFADPLTGALAPNWLVRRVPRSSSDKEQAVSERIWEFFSISISYLWKNLDFLLACQVFSIERSRRFRRTFRERSWSARGPGSTVSTTLNFRRWIGSLFECHPLERNFSGNVCTNIFVSIFYICFYFYLENLVCFIKNYSTKFA